MLLRRLYQVWQPLTYERRASYDRINGIGKWYRVPGVPKPARDRTTYVKPNRDVFAGVGRTYERDIFAKLDYAGLNWVN